eukprot:1145026-Pelagomonas_calceolata.AAC.2
MGGAKCTILKGESSTRFLPQDGLQGCSSSHGLGALMGMDIYRRKCHAHHVRLRAFQALLAMQIKNQSQHVYLTCKQEGAAGVTRSHRSSLMVVPHIRRVILLFKESAKLFLSVAQGHCIPYCTCCSGKVTGPRKKDIFCIPMQH